MNDLLFFTGVAVWVACGVASGGLYFAHFQRKFWLIRMKVFHQDQMLSVLAMLFGPFALLSLLLCGYADYGWLWPWSAKAKAEAESA